MNDNKLYEVSMRDGYIWTRVWGDAGADVFEASTKEVIALHKAHNVNVLLCDIRELTPNNVGIADQTRGIGTLWEIRSFDKVALLLGDSRITSMLHTALNIAHLSDKFQNFDSEAEAAVWLKSA